MDLNQYLKAVRKEAKEHKAADETVPPSGWYTISELQKLFNMRWRHNASTRAASMYARGVLQRMPWRGVSPEGQPFRAFVYRPVPPAKSIEQAIAAFICSGQQPVPKGYARPTEIADRLHISAVAVREMARRHRVKGIMIRTLRGSSGLHDNLYYREADLVALHRRRRKH